MPKKDFDVSIFHASDVTPLARELSETLRSAGFHPWLDVETIPNVAQHSERWDREIVRAIEGTSVHVVFISPGLGDSAFASYEAGGASGHAMRDDGVKLILVLANGASRREVRPILLASAPALIDANRLNAFSLAKQLLPLLPNPISSAETHLDRRAKSRGNARKPALPEQHPMPKKAAQSA